VLAVVLVHRQRSAIEWGEAVWPVQQRRPDEAVVAAVPRAGDPEHMDVVFLTAKTVDRDGAEVN